MSIESGSKINVNLHGNQLERNEALKRRRVSIVNALFNTGFPDVLGLSKGDFDKKTSDHTKSEK